LGRQKPYVAIRPNLRKVYALIPISNPNLFAFSFRMARQKAKTSIFMQRVSPNSTCREEQLIQGPLLNHFGAFGQAEQQPVIRLPAATLCLP
jgi:hypothetical protein